jgi:hypothetical protein
LDVGGACAAPRIPRLMPSTTTATAASRAGVIEAAPIAAAHTIALIGSTPANKPARSTPSHPIAAYQSTKPQTVTSEPR